MELKDYTTEELRMELKKRNAEEKAKKDSVLRFKMCKHWGEIEYRENPINYFFIGNTLVNSSILKMEGIIDAVLHQNLLVKTLKERRNSYEKNTIKDYHRRTRC